MAGKKFSAAQRAKHRNNSLIELGNSRPLGDKINVGKLDLVFEKLNSVLKQVEFDEEISVNPESEAIAISQDGSWFKITPNFHSMCEVFEMIALDVGKIHRFKSLREFASKIGLEEEFAQHEIDSARQDIQYMRDLAKSYTPNELAIYIDVIRTRIEFERLGISGNKKNQAD